MDTSRQAIPVYHFVRDILEPGLRMKSLRRGPRVSTQRTDSCNAKNLAEFFGNMHISHAAKVRGRQLITANEINAYREARLREGVSELTIQRALAVGSSVCSIMHSTAGMDVPNPFRGRTRVEAYRPRERRGEIRERWQESETERFLAVAEPIIRDITIFALNTGCRISEILNLTMTSRYMGASYERVYQSPKGWRLCFSPKDQGSKHDSVCALNATAVEVLERQERAEVNERDGSGKPLLHTYCFSLDGNKISRDQFAYRFNRERGRAGLAHLQFRHTRNTCAQRMLDKGASLEDVRVQLRLASVEYVRQMFFVPQIGPTASVVDKIG